MFFELADSVKVSDDDLEWIDPGPHPQRQKVDQILKAGPSIVVLTKGDKGACAYLRDGSETVAPADVAGVVDKVGAGDTFNAGLLANLAERGWLSKKSLATIEPAEILIALRFGGKVAAITVSRSGANPPWRQEVAKRHHDRYANRKALAADAACVLLLQISQLTTCQKMHGIDSQFNEKHRLHRVKHRIPYPVLFCHWKLCVFQIRP